MLIEWFVNFVMIILFKELNISKSWKNLHLLRWFANNWLIKSNRTVFEQWNNQPNFLGHLEENKWKAFCDITETHQTKKEESYTSSFESLSRVGIPHWFVISALCLFVPVTHSLKYRQKHSYTYTLSIYKHIYRYIYITPTHVCSH